MTVPSDIPANQEALREQAAAWHVRLGSDQAEEADWLAFEEWLAASPDHQAAYEEVESVWMALDDLPPDARTTPAGAAVDAPPTAAPNVVRLTPRPRPSAWIGRLAASLAVAVGAGFLAWNVTPHTETYSTDRGEREVVALSDGSRITLNGGSRIKVRMSRSERHVEMAEAEAAFDVAKDPSRPFVIEAGDRQIRVVGTEFNVLRRSGEVKVTVRRGVVEVRPGKQPKAPPLARLTAGQGLAHQEGRSGDAVGAADPEAAFAWTQGRLIFRNERLQDVASVLNRYVETPVTVAPEAREMRVTAVLTLDREDTMLDRLTTFLPVELRRREGSVEIGLRRGQR